ncbi:MAG TPA: hypothetical protein VL221_04710 [Bacteroidota bacterium]|nr:hypothetical protein [Bacteroidota bacterium]
MDLRKELVGEYTGSFAPSAGGSRIVVRNRTRIYESDKGHLSYVITEHVTDQQKRVSRRETYVGLVTGNIPGPDEGVFHLHLSPLEKAYRGGNDLRCDFLFSEDFNSYFLVFTWSEGDRQVQFRLKKTSSNGTGRRRRRK